MVDDLEKIQLEEDLSKEISVSNGRVHPTAMISSFGWLARFVSRVLFAHVFIETKDCQNLVQSDDETSSIYVMQSRSLLDYLFFNWLFVHQDIALARFSNGVKLRLFQSIWKNIVSWFQFRKLEDDQTTFTHLLQNEHSVFLFLKRGNNTKVNDLDYVRKFLFSAIGVQRERLKNIRVIPLLLVWERRPDKPHATIAEEVFGSAQSPRFLRKVMYWFRTIWQSFLKFGQPVARVCEPIFLQNFVADLPDATTGDLAQLLEAELSKRIYDERHVILGPPEEKPEHIWKEISTKSHMMQTFSSVAKEEGISEKEVLIRAEKLFREIAAEPNLMVLKILSSLFSFVWYRLYDGLEIDLSGLEKIREVSKDHSIVLIPSHKSHMDYLIITYVFYHYGIKAPLIAAGANLNFWPLGYLFRRGGAFYIRRSFKDNALYKAVFREYLNTVLERRYPVEFFIEGTRSRTGKLVKPRYGMLEMIVSGVKSARLDAVKLIPISVVYEHVIESKSHKQEQLGAEKEKEGLSGLLKTPQFLARKYGRIHIEFNEPIDLKNYLNRNTVDENEEEHAALMVRLGHRIIYDINTVTTVTPSALTSLVLLSDDRTNGIGRAELLADVGFVYRYLSEPKRNVRFSKTIEDALAEKKETLEGLAEGSHAERHPLIESMLGRSLAPLIDIALERFRQADQIIVEKNAEKEDRFIVPADGRIELAYSKNSIVHHFVPEALLATAIRSFDEKNIDLEALKSQTLFLSRLFKYEWIYEERSEFDSVFSTTLDYFGSRSWISVKTEDEKDYVSHSRPFPEELAFFRTQVLNFVEAYLVVVDTLRESPSISEKKIITEALKYATERLENGELHFRETLSKPTYVNTLRLLQDWNYIDRVKSSNEGYVYKIVEQDSLDKMSVRLQRLCAIL